MVAPDPAPSSPVTVSPPAAHARLDFIDALRGIAALWVVVYHVVVAFCGWPPSSPNNVAQAFLTAGLFGQVGVNLFLVISGFCLFYPLVRRQQGNQPIEFRLKSFALRRARRILPPYYAALAVSCALFWLGTWLQGRIPNAPLFLNTTPQQLGPAILTHVLLIHNLIPDQVGSVLAPMWSVALECQLYVTFPLLVLLYNRARVIGLLAATLALSCLFQVMILHLILRHDIPGDVWGVRAAAYWSLPSRIFEFALGMAAATLVARGDRRVAVAALAVFLGLARHEIRHYYIGDTMEPYANQWWGLLFAALIVALGGLMGSGAEHRAHRACQTTFERLIRPLTVVGTFSYSLYLTHELVLNAVAPWVVAQHFPSTTTLVLLLFVGMPLVLGYAYVFHCLFERPFLRAPAGLIDRRAATAPEHRAVPAEPAPRLPSPAVATLP